MILFSMPPRRAAHDAGVLETMDDQVYKDALLRKRIELLGTGGIKPIQASMENNTRLCGAKK